MKLRLAFSAVFFVLAVVFLLGGCASKPVNVPTGWASAVVKPSDPVPVQCDSSQDKDVPPIKDGNPATLAKYADRLLDQNGELRKNRKACGAWTRKQR